MFTVTYNEPSQNLHTQKTETYKSSRDAAGHSAVHHAKQESQCIRGAALDVRPVSTLDSLVLYAVAHCTHLRENDRRVQLLHLLRRFVERGSELLAVAAPFPHYA